MASLSAHCRGWSTGFNGVYALVPPHPDTVDAFPGLNMGDFSSFFNAFEQTAVVLGRTGGQTHWLYLVREGQIFCQLKAEVIYANFSIPFVHLQDSDVIIAGRRVEVKLWVLVDGGGEDEGRGGLAVVVLSQHHPEGGPVLQAHQVIAPIQAVGRRDHISLKKKTEFFDHQF